MYRTTHFRWKLMHAGCILAHLNLVVSVATSYIYDLGRNAEPIQWAVPALTGANRCGSVLSMASPSPFSFDAASHILLKACFLMGTIGFVLNIVLFIFLLAVEPNRITLTEGEQHWRKLVVTFFGCVLNFLLACSAIGLTLTLSTKVTDYSPLIAPLVCTYIQGTLAFATAICDAFKNYKEGQDLLD
ncbi:hypothetical protein VTJ04DRAFT_8451 [Mycothermus thermophilus]|uniref:uncharacterized protein n=1 Tax=Humicola insolens TaxID=85995 RepID=UPI003743FE53